jgi:hypothetical protein
MNPTGRTRLDDLEVVQQFWKQQRNLSAREQVESKLAHLQVFISQLKQTTSGQTELRSRLKRFGDCERMAGEGTSHFYGRLRLWLDTDIAG